VGDAGDTVADVVLVVRPHAIPEQRALRQVVGEVLVVRHLAVGADDGGYAVGGVTPVAGMQVRQERAACIYQSRSPQARGVPRHSRLAAALCLRVRPVNDDVAGLVWDVHHCLRLASIVREVGADAVEAEALSHA